MCRGLALNLVRDSKGKIEAKCGFRDSSHTENAKKLIDKVGIDDHTLPLEIMVQYGKLVWDIDEQRKDKTCVEFLKRNGWIKECKDSVTKESLMQDVVPFMAKWIKENRFRICEAIALYGETRNYGVFKGDIRNDYQKSKGDIRNDCQKSKGDIRNGRQKSKGNIRNDCQESKSAIWNAYQESKGDIRNGRQKSKGDITNDYQKSKGDITNDYQKSKGDIRNDYQESKSAIWNDCQKSKGDIWNDRQESKGAIRNGRQKSKGNIDNRFQEAKQILVSVDMLPLMVVYDMHHNQLTGKVEFKEKGRG